MRKQIFLLLCIPLLLVGCKHSSTKHDTNSFLFRIQESHDLGISWLLGNVKENGIFQYIYHPKTDEYLTSNNAIRQLMSARLLAELASEDASLLSVHKKNIEFYMKHWYKKEGDLGYVWLYEKSKLGANAMLLRTLVFSPYYEEYKDEARSLADGILSLQEQDGGFIPWFKGPSYKYDKDYMLTFYSGEAILALIEFYEKEPSTQLLQDITRLQEYYIDRYVSNIEEHYYPAYVPWHTMALNKLWKIQPRQEYVKSIFILNDTLLEIQDRTQYIGRFYNPETPQYGTPHSSSDGVYTEGLVYAYEIALMAKDTGHILQYEDALRIALPNLISLQYTKETAFRYKRPDRAIGGLKYSADRSGIRIDTVQHTMDAYRKLLSLAEKSKINWLY